MSDLNDPIHSRLEKTGQHAKVRALDEWYRHADAPPVSAFFDGSPVPAFAIDADHVVTLWNKACEKITGIPATAMIGTSNHWQAFYKHRRPVLADLVVDGNAEDLVERYYRDKIQPSTLIPDAYEVEDFFPQLGESGRWFFFSAAPLRNEAGRIVGAIEVLQDATSRKFAEIDLHNVHARLEELVERRTAQLAEANERLVEDVRRREAAEAELLRRNNELTELNEKLGKAQEKLLQSEKMASIGQLAAGVAHEINNPIGYIFSNFGALDGYILKVFEMLDVYEEAATTITSPDIRARISAARQRLELDYLKDDIPALMNESREGIVRVRKIVQDLKDFSRADLNQQWQWANIHRGIDSTLNIVNNEVKYKADVVKEYGNIPDIECLPSQINQVIMNLIVNAAQAIEGNRGTITISTGCHDSGDHIWFKVADTGSGIPREVIPRIFDPFFTTKPIGSGTGLGLSLSYGIVQKHQGRIDVDSEEGRGTVFTVTLPVRHTEPAGKMEGET
jgi:two-component system, NtrC family, sensor kinase